jgi:hypothetical protein
MKRHRDLGMITILTEHSPPPLAQIAWDRRALSLTHESPVTSEGVVYRIAQCRAMLLNSEEPLCERASRACSRLEQFLDMSELTTDGACTIMLFLSMAVVNVFACSLTTLLSPS